MSLFVSYLLLKLTNGVDFNHLILIERVFGWFFVEHVFENYSQTSGKFFIINNDFRKLICNIWISMKKIIFSVYFTTAVEFINLLFLLAFLIYLLILQFYQNNLVRIVQTVKKNFITIFCYICIIFLLIYKIFSVFSWFDVYFIFQPFLLFNKLNKSFIISIFLFYSLFNFPITNNRTVILKSTLIKLSSYCLTSLVILCLFFNLFTLSSVYNENFVQEFVIQFLFVYSFLICF